MIRTGGDQFGVVRLASDHEMREMAMERRAEYTTTAEQERARERLILLSRYHSGRQIPLRQYLDVVYPDLKLEANRETLG